MSAIISEFANKADASLQPVVLELDKVLMKLQPAFKPKLAWNGYAYKIGDNYSVIQVIYKDHIKLMIWRAVSFDDKFNLLEGVGKNTRHIKFYEVKDINKAAIANYLHQQQELYDSGVIWE